MTFRRTSAHVNTENKGNVSILYLAGEFSYKNIHRVEGEWNKQMEHNPEIIGINCAEILYLDSSALGKLIWLNDNAAHRNIKLVFYDMNSSMRKLFATYKLQDVFSIITKEEFEEMYLHQS
ncbi:MAG TPA: STAS domain-containing protein [Spirochaetota bacterium]|nr:STAS domain-containing protein [Spirochaetota bacterium]